MSVPTDEADLADLERLAPPAAVPLAYQARQDARRPPFDYWRAVRQIIFASGVGFLAGGIADTGWYSEGWRDNGILWIGFGAGMIALVVPWPGGFGRRGVRDGHER